MLRWRGRSGVTMDDECLLRTGNATERALLAAGLNEGPTPESIRAASMALGLLSTTTGTASVAEGLRKHASARWLKATLQVAAPIALVGGAVAALHVAGGGSRPTTPVAVVLAPSVARPSTVTDEIDERGTSLPLARSPDTSSSEVDHDLLVQTQSSGSAEPASPPSAADSARKAKIDTFGAQVALIDRARAMAALGDSAAALQAVGEYNRRFPGGLLSEEALLLRIEALSAGSRDPRRG